MEIRKPGVKASEPNGNGKTKFVVDPMAQQKAKQLLISTYAYQKDVLPLSYADNVLIVGVSHIKIHDEELRIDIARRTRIDVKAIHFHSFDIVDLRAQIALLYPKPKSSPSTVVQLWQDIVDEGVVRNAADILIEPYLDDGRVRFGIDGRMARPYNESMQHISRDQLDGLIGIIKSRGQVQPSNINLPGDGRMTLKAEGSDVDLRISTTPMDNRESASIRLLTSSPLLLDLRKLGMTDNLLKMFEEEINSPQYFIAIAGPTGAGKTTTAHAALWSLPLDEINACSVENPVERRILGLRQIEISIDEEQANEKSQMTFKQALRALLRQYPHLVFVGEIRDVETMEMTISAANSGTNLFVTVHCRSALHVINRFQLLGAEAHAIAESLTMAISQRLLRKLCPECKVKNDLDFHPNTIALAERYHINLTQAYRISANGCQYCYGSGHRDRVGAFEILRISAKIADAIATKQPMSTIGHLALTDGYEPMIVNGLRHLSAGIISEKELRSLISDNEAFLLAPKPTPIERRAIREEPS